MDYYEPWFEVNDDGSTYGSFQNGTFEDNTLSPWTDITGNLTTFAVATDRVNTGTYSAKMVPAGTGDGMEQNISEDFFLGPLYVGDTYRAEAWVSHDSGVSHGISIGFWQNGAWNGIAGYSIPAGTGFTRISHEFTSVDTEVDLRIWSSQAGTPTIWVDDVAFRGPGRGEDFQRFLVTSHPMQVGDHWSPANGNLDLDRGPFNNPFLDKYRYEVWAKGAANQTLEFNWTFWDDEANLESERFFPDDQPPWTYVRVHQDEVQTRQMSADWKKYTFDVPVPWWPNGPTTVAQSGYIGNTSSFVPFRAHVTIRLRVTGGTAGQTTNITDVTGGLLFKTDVPASLLSVGVAEWIQDAQDMYVGARLWFKGASPGELG
jgi:hypothetical protein